MTKIKLQAYPQSISEWEILWKKFPAFAAAKVRKNAKEQGAYKNSDLGTGCNWLRNAFVGSSYGVWGVDTAGARDWAGSDDKGYCSRVALQLIYNPESKPVKGCTLKTQTQCVWFNKNDSAVWEDGKMQKKEVTSTAPVVTYGRKEYIWLNKEECESGKDKTMKLVELEAHECAAVLDKKGNTNDFEKAKELQEQYLRIATESCTNAELCMLVKVEMSKTDNYDTATPVFRKDQEKMLEKTHKQEKSDMEKLLEDYGFENEQELRGFLDKLSELAKPANKTLSKTKSTDDGRGGMGD